MFSYDERMKAVKLYIQYDLITATVILELDCSKNRHTLTNWYKEYKKMNNLHLKSTRKEKFSKEQKRTAIQTIWDMVEMLPKPLKAGLSIPNHVKVLVERAGGRLFNQEVYSEHLSSGTLNARAGCEGPFPEERKRQGNLRPIWRFTTLAQ